LGGEKAVLAKQIDILMEEVRKWDTSKLPPKDEIGDPGIGNAPLLDALNVEIAKLTAANAVLRAEPGHAPELVPGDASLICSFCSKTNTEVARMIKGDKALICDECVALCADIVAEQAKLKAAGSDAETVSGGLSWSGSDATGWTARSSETDLVYTVRRTKARGSKWNVVVYEDGVTLSLSRKPCDSVGLAKEAAEADFAGRGLW
jgi:ClpX C4-type zinc finger